MPKPEQIDECQIDKERVVFLSPEIPGVVRKLVESCGLEDCFDHVNPVPLPSRESVVEIIDSVRRVLFPGYFTNKRIDPVNLEYYLGQEVSALHETLSNQIAWSVRHDCYRYELTCTHCEERGREAALEFIKRLPEIRRVLADDVRAAYLGDPASTSFDEIIFSYPGLFAITVYRMAHVIRELGVPVLPRIMTEYAHSKTGIDIHPGARIGRSFFIDHGTGVVIGATTEIGDRVRIYQGVTLGALSVPSDQVEELRRVKRHPTIEDDVIIYSGATILGGETVIGARSIIGGSVWLTQSVPPDTKVFLKEPQLVYLGNGDESPDRKRSVQ